MIDKVHCGQWHRLCIKESFFIFLLSFYFLSLIVFFCFFSRFFSSFLPSILFFFSSFFFLLSFLLPFIFYLFFSFLLFFYVTFPCLLSFHCFSFFFLCLFLFSFPLFFVVFRRFSVVCLKSSWKYGGGWGLSLAYPTCQPLSLIMDRVSVCLLLNDWLIGLWEKHVCQQILPSHTHMSAHSYARIYKRAHRLTLAFTRGKSGGNNTSQYTFWWRRLNSVFFFFFVGVVNLGSLISKIGSVFAIHVKFSISDTPLIVNQICSLYEISDDHPLAK